MSGGDSGRYRAGETALIAKVPEAEAAVSSWRLRYDPAAAAGVPAHVTVLYPFLNHQAITEEVLRELAGIFARHPAFSVALAQTRRFPGVLCLAPAPETEFRALTSDVAERWPEAPPYGGQFDDVVPHLTIADGQDAGVLDLIESEVAQGLPVRTRITAISLMACTGPGWQEAHTFALAGG